MSEEKTDDAARDALPEAMRQIREILEKHSRLPRMARWLRGRMTVPASLRVHSALHRMFDEHAIAYERGGRWMIGTSEEKTRKQVFDPMSLVGPVWEPRVVEALRAKGLPVEQQRHELSYYLDIALVGRNGMKLNVEIDGRTHRRPDGRRRNADLIRDARLRANGWKVHRIWVRDLIEDFDGCIDETVGIWKKMEGDKV